MLSHRLRRAVAGAIVVSNGNYQDINMSDGSGWIDGDDGNGVSTFNFVDSSDTVLKLDGGASYDATNLARRSKVLTGPAGSRFTFTIRARGIWGASGLSYCALEINYSAAFSVHILLFSTSVTVVDLVAGNTKTFHTADATKQHYYTFDVDTVAKTVDVILDGDPIAVDVPCERARVRTAWETSNEQLSRVLPYVQQIAYVDRLMIGDELTTL